jgi:CBS domain-containing protein
MTVQSILNAKGKGAAHISPNATVGEAIQSLEIENVDALVVSSDGRKLDGIITEHDIVRGLRTFGADLLRKSVRELMTTTVLTCTPFEPVETITAVMGSKHVRHLPVVVNNEFVGIVSIRDLLRLRLLTVESEGDSMRSYISGGSQ